MGLRKAAIYKNIERAYTRKSRVSSKNFIKSFPPTKIVKFQMGNTNKFNEGKYPFVLKMIALKGMQIRENAIEAARQVVLRHLESDIGDFYFGVNVYPHHVLREHKMAAVAQSDRIFAGMSHAFGKPLCCSAQIPKGKQIFIVAVSNENALTNARKILHLARPKIGSDVSIITEQK